jgi:polysaccharide biosynthesis/export protein
MTLAGEHALRAEGNFPGTYVILQWIGTFCRRTLRAEAMSTRPLAAVGLICCLLAPLATAAQTVYTIQAGDQLQVIVFGTQGVPSIQGQQPSPMPSTIQALSQTVTVLSDGTVTYPLIGPVSVAGLPVNGAAQRIAAALEAYVIHPTVSVVIVKGTSATVKVLGSVDHGGQIELQQGDRLVDALAKAGVGPSSFADLNHITLNRIVDGAPRVFNVNLYNMLLNADYSANPLLLAGDVIYVPKAKQYNLANLANIPFALYYLYLLVTPGLNRVRGAVTP